MEHSFDHRRYMSISPVNSDEFAGEIVVDARELQKPSGLRTARKGDLGGREVTSACVTMSSEREV